MNDEYARLLERYRDLQRDLKISQGHDYDDFFAEFVEVSDLLTDYEAFNDLPEHPSADTPTPTQQENTTMTKAIAALPGFVAITNALGQSLYVPQATYNVVDKLIDEGSNIFVYGEAGTAKTELGEAILRAKGFDVYQMETGAITSGDQLDGERTLDSDGKLANVPSELLKAVINAGKGLKTGLLLDELNRVGAPAAVNKLLRLLSGQREYATDLNGVIKVGDDLSVVATANIGYFGTVRLNEAMLDRFDAIHMTPIGGKALLMMLEERFPTVAVKDLERLTKFIDKNRAARKADQDSEIAPLSTRDAIRIARGIKIGMKPIEAITTLVGGQLAIKQMPLESVDALVTEAKAQFAA